MTDASEFRFGSSEHEQERKRREHERFQAEVNGWEPPKPRDLRPSGAPFVMCGMCNTFPANWHAQGWRCSKIQEAIEPGHEACEKWTPRESWKPDPPMFCLRTDKPSHDFGVPRYYEPVLPPSKEPAFEVSYVYFIRCGEFVKIGFSSTPNSRRSSIATSSPFAVEIIGLMRGDTQTEKNLHKRFKHLREKLEWFRLTDEVRMEIKRLCGSERKWRSLLRSCG